MRKLQCYLLILLPILAFSQAPEIPKIEFKSNAEEVNRYVELLGLNDADALVVRIAYSILPDIAPESDYIVYFNNGKVKRYRINESAQPMASPKIKRIRVQKRKYSETKVITMPHSFRLQYLLKVSQVEVPVQGTYSGSSPHRQHRDKVRLSFCPIPLKEEAAGSKEEEKEKPNCSRHHRTWWAAH